MLYLLVVSLLWAFSFGLIKGQLSGIPSASVAFIRLFFSLLVFLPLLRPRKIALSLTGKLILTGMLQYGLMYITYLHAFSYLAAWQVALFTVFTPLYLAIINDFMCYKFHWHYFLGAFLALSGAFYIQYQQGLGSASLTGFALLQVSNICFALGQLLYRRWMEEAEDIKDHQVFAWLFLGGIIPAGIMAGFSDISVLSMISKAQWLVLIYLGVVASGLGFFLWNFGARKTNAGVLAVFNNLKIPLAIAVSLIFFNEKTDLVRLLTGGMAVLAGLWISQHFDRSQSG